EFLTEPGTRLATDDDGFHLRQIAFLIVRESLKELLARDQTQDAVAEEFEPLVGRGAGVGAGRVSQRRPQQFRPFETVADCVLTVIEYGALSVTGRSVQRRHERV